MARDHIDRVLASVLSREDAARSAVAASWLRCFQRHNLDPALRKVDAVKDSARLQEQHEVLGRLIRIAGPRLEDLHRMISHSGRAAFLTDRQGLVLVSRVRDSDADLFETAGLVDGADWSEAVQGTNGIGTCVTEGRPVIIHRTQHYLAQNTAMSCIDAPVFGPDGQLVAALDISSARADDSEGFNQLIGAMVTKVAYQIETDLFRDTHDGQRIVLVGQDDAAPALFAVDRDDLVIGATRAARRQFNLRVTGQIRPVPLRDLSGEDALGLSRAGRAAVVHALARHGGNASAAARDLGIGRATLYRRMQALGIDENTRKLSQS